MSIKFKINGLEIETSNIDNDMPLLWFLRENKKLKGTKFGCGIGQCGACTVHIDGEAVRSCTVPLATLKGKNIVTIEGLATSESELHPVQRAWMEIDVPQCGYCQSGQIMSAAALLSKNTNPTDTDIDKSMTNICRCASYTRIRKAIHQAALYTTPAENKG